MAGRDEEMRWGKGRISRRFQRFRLPKMVSWPASRHAAHCVKLELKWRKREEDGGDALPEPQNPLDERRRKMKGKV